MSGRVLVANRGEIAIRVIRACRDLGYSSIAVYSEVDADAEHVRLADESVCIGAASAASSYLNQEAILEAARLVRADAVHPGYGFLSENAAFARRVVGAGLIWIGPAPATIELMGDKAAARAAASAAGLPLVPGTGAIADSEALAAAESIGYPLLIKAAAGGGGRGIRRVDSPAELDAALAEARREVGAAFGDSTVYLERALLNVRHIEVQVLGDGRGGVVHLWERDCSIQRRRQKVIEEAPAPTQSAETRLRICDSAAELARSLSYASAGTVEFLVDRDGVYYFIEMNTRIQVEHGITELVTGIDLVVEQIRIAFGGTLSVQQDELRCEGAAIEIRINAENPDFHFLGSPGVLTACVLPSGPGLRVDSGVVSGSTVQPYYDSMVAKVMAYGRDRQTALARARRALAEIRIEGVITTTQFVSAVLDREWFERAEYDTGTLESELAE